VIEKKKKNRAVIFHSYENNDPIFRENRGKELLKFTYPVAKTL